MTFVSTALAMLALLFGLGSPVALLVLPRRWRVHWPIVAPMAGGALIAVMTWCGVWMDVRISISFARTSLVVPVALAVIAAVRDRGHLGEIVIGGLRRHAVVLLLGLGVLISLARPLVEARLGLTTVSFGSCDAADYAAGANLMREFAQSEPGGFNNQTEVVALRSVDTFYGHWLRLNHFAPAGVLAWFASLFELPVFKLVTALGVALHAAAVPAVFWIARAGLRLGPWMSLGVAACWGCSAPAVYGVAQTALGQTMVVPAVALLSWAGLRSFAEGWTWRGAMRWLPLAALGFVVVVAAYTFALVFVLAPLAVSLLWLAWRTRDARRLAFAVACDAGALALVGLVFAERMAGLADRFALFEAIDFGWFIPVFTPERWLGWFGDARLGPGSSAVGWAVVVVMGAAAVAFGATSWRRDGLRIGVALAWLATVALGYSILALRGLREGNNEVYNAYKVFALLHPLVLAAAFLPLRRTRGAWRSVAGVLGVGLVVVHWVGATPMRVALRQPDLWVDKPLAGLAVIAQRVDIETINMRLEPMWTRLWANSMLLGKRQYFRTTTYEGRRSTELRGAWDLCDGLLAVDTGETDTVALAGGYHLVRRDSSGFFEINLGVGWHSPEGSGAGRWVWSSGESVLVFSNPHERALPVRLSFGLQGNGARHVTIAVDGREALLWSGPVATVTAPVEIGGLVLPPGETVVRIRSAEPAFAPPGDGRLLAFALHDLVATVESQEK